MPEIPDLEAIRGFLNERLPGQSVDSVEVKIPHVVRTGARALAESLPGDAFGETNRLGKFLLFTLASGRVLAINPMLTGRFQYAPPEAKRQGRTCLRLTLSGGNELRYADLRVMGRIYLLPLEELETIPNWSAGGPRPARRGPHGGGLAGTHPQVPRTHQEHPHQGRIRAGRG